MSEDLSALYNSMENLKLWPIRIRFPMIHGIAVWGSGSSDHDRVSSGGSKIVLARSVTELSLLAGNVTWPDSDQLLRLTELFAGNRTLVNGLELVNHDFARALIPMFRSPTSWPAQTRELISSTLNLSWDIARSVDDEVVRKSLARGGILGSVADYLVGSGRPAVELGETAVESPESVGSAFAAMVGRLQAITVIVKPPGLVSGRSPLSGP